MFNEPEALVEETEKEPETQTVESPIMPNHETGELQFQHFPANGLSDNSWQIANINDALILIHDGSDHYLAGAASDLPPEQLSSHNTSEFFCHNARRVASSPALSLINGKKRSETQ